MNANPVVAGSLISGLGTGLSNYAAASSANAAAKELADRQAANYDISGENGNGLLGRTDGAPPTTGAPLVAPTTRFDPNAYGGQYRWDPALNQVVFVKGG